MYNLKKKKKKFIPHKHFRKKCSTLLKKLSKKYKISFDTRIWKEKMYMKFRISFYLSKGGFNHSV